MNYLFFSQESELDQGLKDPQSHNVHSEHLFNIYNMSNIATGIRNIRLIKKLLAIRKAQFCRGVTDSTFIDFFKFIYFERERERQNMGGAERKGERKSQAGSALSAQSPTWGSNPQM